MMIAAGSAWSNAPSLREAACGCVDCCGGCAAAPGAAALAAATAARRGIDRCCARGGVARGGGRPRPICSQRTCGCRHRAPGLVRLAIGMLDHLNANGGTSEGSGGDSRRDGTSEAAMSGAEV